MAIHLNNEDVLAFVPVDSEFSNIRYIKYIMSNYNYQHDNIKRELLIKIHKQSSVNNIIDQLLGIRTRKNQILNNIWQHY
jgi:hypothetical protein